MPNQQTAYPLNAVRALALHTQALDAPPPDNPAPDANAIYDTIQQIGWVQLDTLQMVRRSQYIALWSRLGAYQTDDLDSLIFGDGSISGDNHRRLFEYWMHAACIIPLTAYRYTMPTMQRYTAPQSKNRRRWLEDAHNIKLLEDVLEQVRLNGLARSTDFDRSDGRRGTWWDWKPAKIALEHLYNTGALTIANRINFQRIYGLTDAVLPDWVDRTPPTEEAAALHLLEQSALSLGICSATQLPDYFHMKRTPAKPLVKRLIDDGVLLQIHAQMHDGSIAEQVVHRDNISLLHRAADGDIAPCHTTFLTPFDNLFWAKDRDMQYWGFQQILEAYKPEPIRKWGYFCLPILHGNRLVGRLDPKLERRTATLRIKHFYLEPGTTPDEALAASIAEAMRSFMAFHAAKHLVIEHIQPKSFRRKLLSAFNTLQRRQN